MTPHNWYRLLPVEFGRCDDFAFAVGQSWELIKPLLFELGYLFTKGGDRFVNADKFIILGLVRFGKHQLHISNTHFKGDKKTYYLCMGKPHFSGPVKQLYATTNGVFAFSSIRYMNASDTRLRTKLQEHIGVVINDNSSDINLRDQDRISNLDTTQNTSSSSEAPIQARPLILPKISDFINDALSLDLRMFPRPNRNDPTKLIPIKETNVANQCTKLIVLITAEKWGLNIPTLKYKERMRIARAASRLIAYDNGFISEFSVTSILRWDKEVLRKVKDGVGTNLITNHIRHVPKKYVDIIEERHPGYLHYLYRKAIKLKGPKASFLQLSVAMNNISNITSETRTPLTLHRLQLNRWFWKNGGTEKSGLEKPLDLEKHKLLRKDWVMKWYGLLASPFAPVCYIDEKWFYRTNRRRKIKILPLGKHEESGDDAYSHPKMLSRRFPIKSMFMGVVGRPVAHRQFDGKFFLERVSKTKYITMCTAHTNFSDDALVNAEIKNGE